jgi:hypothetical protein
MRDWRVVPQEDLTVIFSNVESLLKVNTALLHKLKSRMKKFKNDSDCIADIFIDIVSL